MFLSRIWFVLIMTPFLLFSACMKDQNESTLEPTGNRNLELVKLSSYGIHDQNASNQAKEMLSYYDEIAGVRAVNHDKDLLIAIDVRHHDRFNLDSIESDVRKKINKNFSDLKVTLSTDRKILIELEKLEKRMEAQDISDEQLKSRIKKIKSLTKEET